MSEIIVAGIGQIPVGEHWGSSLRTMAARAISAALKDAGNLRPHALYIGNLLSPVVSHQANLGALLTSNSSLNGIEAFTVEAAEASSAGAFRLAVMAIRSGFIDSALVVGVEKVTDMVSNKLETHISEILDYDYEDYSGLTPNGLAGLLMQRYMHEYSVPRNAFADFAVIPHNNAAGNPNAYFHNQITAETYEKIEPVVDPLKPFDIAPVMDGAAAIMLTRADLLPNDFPHPRVRVTGSANSIDALSIHDRNNPLDFGAARQSIEQACCQAGILPRDVDFYEFSDTHTIHTCLSLEVAGIARKGEAWRLSQNGALADGGGLRISTMGGCMGRGNVLGANGAYQIAEAALQLRGQAGACQVPNAKRALVQALGGAAGTAITHILQL